MLELNFLGKISIGLTDSEAINFTLLYRYIKLMVIFFFSKVVKKISFYIHMYVCMFVSTNYTLPPNLVYGVKSSSHKYQFINVPRATNILLDSFPPFSNSFGKINRNAKIRELFGSNRRNGESVEGE